LALAGVADLIQTLFISQLLDLLTCAVILILSFTELFRFKRREILEVFVGIAFLCLFGAASIRAYPWQIFFPALAISLTMLAFNFLGDGLRDALDPRMRR
jgi:hypothetical protein